MYGTYGRVMQLLQEKKFYPGRCPTCDRCGKFGHMTFNYLNGKKEVYKSVCFACKNQCHNCNNCPNWKDELYEKKNE